jgi:small conductance mechanosensitive channel
MIATFLQDYTASIVRTAIIVGAVVVAYLLTARYGRRVVRRITARGGDDVGRADSLWSMMRRLLLLVAALVLVLMVMSTWGLSIAPLLAVGSAVGVALGFGAQSLVKDVIAGFFILAEDQYRIGQVIRIAGVAGVVEDIRPRVTVLRDLDGNVHYVPNGEISVASNLTQEFAQVVLDVGVAYKTDLDRALGVLADELSALASDPDWSPMVVEQPSVLGVEQLGDSSITLRAVMKVGALDRWSVRREALRRVKGRFDAEGIEIPFPHLTVYRGDDTAD